MKTKKGKICNVADLAKQYGKPDMERLGLFIEMPYMNGKGYVSPFPKPRVFKGRGILGEGTKSKNGTQHGYFEKEFRRLFVGEAIAIAKRPKKKPQASNLPFLPGGATKVHSGAGDYFGCFSGVVTSFGGKFTPKKPSKKEPPNCLTNPGKKGNAGYANICLSKFPEYIPSPYAQKAKYKQYGADLGGPLRTVVFPCPFFDTNPYHEKTLGPRFLAIPERPHATIGDGRWIPTGPAKKQGGCHFGLFSKNPEHISDRDRKLEAKLVKDRAKKLAEQSQGFQPQSMALKNMLTTSVLARNTEFRVNATNYKTYEPITIPEYHITGDGIWTPTGPAKKQGGGHFGLFSKTPEYMTNRNKTLEAKEAKERAKKLAELGDGFKPQSTALKTMPNTSVLARNTDLRVNATNYKTYEPVYIKHLVD